MEGIYLKDCSESLNESEIFKSVVCEEIGMDSFKIVHEATTIKGEIDEFTGLFVYRVSVSIIWDPDLDRRIVNGIRKAIHLPPLTEGEE